MDINQLNRAYVEQYYIEQYEKDLIMNKKRKHAELIKAWADGAVIHERRYILNGWTTWRLFEGDWDAEDTEFRIRIEPKPDVVMEYLVDDMGTILLTHKNPKLKLTFDGETGELKSAEVLK